MEVRGANKERNNNIDTNKNNKTNDSNTKIGENVDLCQVWNVSSVDTNTLRTPTTDLAHALNSTSVKISPTNIW